MKKGTYVLPLEKGEAQKQRQKILGHLEATSGCQVGSEAEQSSGTLNTKDAADRKWGLEDQSPEKQG